MHVSDGALERSHRTNSSVLMFCSQLSTFGLRPPKTLRALSQRVGPSTPSLPPAVYLHGQRPRFGVM